MAISVYWVSLVLPREIGFAVVTACPSCPLTADEAELFGRRRNFLAGCLEARRQAGNKPGAPPIITTIKVPVSETKRQCILEDARKSFRAAQFSVGRPVGKSTSVGPRGMVFLETLADAGAAINERARSVTTEPVIIRA
jgi:hypothetical protein